MNNALRYIHMALSIGFGAASAHFMHQDSENPMMITLVIVWPILLIQMHVNFKSGEK